MREPGPALTEVLALEREAGTPAAAEARRLLRTRLEALGYQVDVQPFAFTAASLNAFPLFGAGLGWLAILALPLLTLPSVPAWGALAAELAGVGSLTLLAIGAGLGWVPLGSAVREDANLIAVRPGGVVRRWIVAHSDTKAQRHSMAGRLVAVWVAILAVLAIVGTAVWRLSGPLPLHVGAGVAGLTLAAGILAGRGRLRGGSVGARDNGSGLVAALTAAAGTSDSGVGILLTGAEEFGLIGARMFARAFPGRLAGTEVVNLDTLDDTGTLYVVSHDRAGARLAGRELGRLGALDCRVRRRSLPIGIFVDSHPLARGGAAAITLGRLDWSTLRRIHTPRDTADGLEFATARAVGRLVAEPN